MLSRCQERDKLFTLGPETLKLGIRKTIWLKHLYEDSGSNIYPIAYAINGLSENY